MGVPWYAIALMLAGPSALGLARVCIAVAHRFGWERHPRPDYLDLTKRP
jgi:hypothetical protein